MADWSVLIAVVDGRTVFQTQLQPGNTSTTYMAPGDTLSWDNKTPETLQPAIASPVPGAPLFQSDPIPPGQPSTPAWVAPKAAPATYSVSAKLANGSLVTGSIIVANAPK